MSSLRLRARAEVDGELHLRGLPIHKGEEADVVVFTDESPESAILEVLTHDPAWAWLHDPAEDIYSDKDIR